MVYCGKASQGCKLCRTRRIKCDKKKPECSQCLRVAKKCPGYRDQLSLMFRDESSKVIQKAHAQWGISENPVESNASSSASSPTATTSRAPKTPSASGSKGSQPSQATEPPPLAVAVVSRHLVPSSIPRKVEASPEQRGLQFYIDRYLMNNPDSPRTAEEIDGYCSSTGTTRNVMIAVGLAGMSNLLGNKSMSLLARSRYVSALKQTGQLIAGARSELATLAPSLRSIVMLAMFEVVQGKGARISTSSANTHLQGAIALLSSVLPIPGAPDGGSRMVLQMLFSLYIPARMSGIPLPPPFFECLRICKELLGERREACCVDLALAIARLLKLLAMVQHTVFTDECPGTNQIMQQCLVLATVFDELEGQLMEAYPYMVNHGPDYPPRALFHNKWHTYNDIWAARLWNHFRWGRILLNQEIVGFATKYPRLNSRCMTACQTEQCYAVMERMAEDILISVPSHWHHPILDTITSRRFEASGQGGSGAVGLPSLLWHMMAAGCAPGVPKDYWDWAYDVQQVVWKDMGMQHAQGLSELMEEHRDRQEKEASARSPSQTLTIEVESGEDEETA